MTTLGKILVGTIASIAGIVTIIVATVAFAGYIGGMQAQMDDLQERMGATEERVGDLPLPYRRMPVGSLMLRQSPGGCPDDWVSVDFRAGDGTITRPCVKTDASPARPRTR